MTIAGAGAKAIATTSAGVAWSLGLPDGVGLGAKRAAAVTARIVTALDVPVSAGLAQQALTGSRRETAVRCAWTPIASPANPSSARPVGSARPGRHLALRRASQETPRSCPGSAARTGSAGVQILAGRPFAGVLHRVSRPVITMPGRTRGAITGNSTSTNVPAVAATCGLAP